MAVATDGTPGVLRPVNGSVNVAVVLPGSRLVSVRGSVSADRRVLGLDNTALSIDGNVDLRRPAAPFRERVRFPAEVVGEGNGGVFEGPGTGVEVEGDADGDGGDGSFSNGGGLGTSIGGGRGTGDGTGRRGMAALGIGMGVGFVMTMVLPRFTATPPMLIGGGGSRRPTMTISPCSFEPNGPRSPRPVPIRPPVRGAARSPLNTRPMMGPSSYGSSQIVTGFFMPGITSPST